MRVTRVLVASIGACDSSSKSPSGPSSTGVGSGSATNIPHQVELTDTPASGIAALTTAINQHKPVAVFGPELSNEAIGGIVVSKRQHDDAIFPGARTGNIGRRASSKMRCRDI
jgi:hypothetical protein